jgi:hypothetical protein
MASREVQDAVGAAPDLEARAAELRKIAATKTPQQKAADELLVVEQQLAIRAAADLQRDAKQRLLGIVRAAGSLAALLDDDDRKVIAAAKVYAEALTTVNERFGKLALLRHEALALAEVFGLPTPVLPQVMVPAMRAAAGEAAEIVTSVRLRDNGYIVSAHDADPHGATLGRNYTELEGTDGYALIQRRGAQQLAPA